MYKYIFIFSFPLLSLLPSCALLGGGSEPSVPRAKGYQIKVPNSWKPISASGESDSAYTNSNGSTATITSICTREAKLNSDILTKQLLLGAKNIIYKEKKKIIVDSQEGQFSSVQASLDKNSFNLLIFVLPNNNCVFDFTLLNPKPFVKEEQMEFITFFSSFKYGTN